MIHSHPRIVSTEPALIDRVSPSPGPGRILLDKTSHAIPERDTRQELTDRQVSRVIERALNHTVVEGRSAHGLADLLFLVPIDEWRWSRDEEDPLSIAARWPDGLDLYDYEAEAGETEEVQLAVEGDGRTEE